MKVLSVSTNSMKRPSAGRVFGGCEGGLACSVLLDSAEFRVWLSQLGHFLEKIETSGDF